MNWILITGARGYLGSQLSSHYSSIGFKIIALDSENKFDLQNPNIVQIQSDFSNMETLSYIFETYPPQYIIHAAAKSSVLEGENFPDEYHQANVHKFQIFLNYLKFIQWSGHLIFCSSSSVYGNAYGCPEEHAPLLPLSVYGKSKLAGEELLALGDAHYTHSILRLFNVVGYLPHFSLALNSPQRIMQIIYELKNSKVFCHFYRRDLATYSLNKRDFIHVLDVIELINKLLSFAPGSNAIINCGSSLAYSVQDLLNFSSEILNCEYHPEFAPSSSVEATISLANIDLAQREYSWSPKHDVKECLKSTFSYLERTRSN